MARPGCTRMSASLRIANRVVTKSTKDQGVSHGATARQEEIAHQVVDAVTGLPVVVKVAEAKVVVVSVPDVVAASVARWWRSRCVKRG